MDSRWLITCDHATNFIPPFVNGGDLGLPAEDMARHIAFDPGAYGVARQLGEALGAPVVASNFSRLVIDPNRGEDDPTLLMKLYDGTIIPANRHADEAELEMRLNRCHRPYHDTVAELGRAARRHCYCCHPFLHTAAARATAAPVGDWHTLSRRGTAVPCPDRCAGRTGRADGRRQ